MNATHAQHAGMAVLLQIVICLLTGNILAASIAGPFLFFGREHWDQSLRLKKTEGYDGPMQWRTTVGALDLRKWPTDAKIDFLVTIPAVLPLFLVYRWY
jgi:hypothetical protein